MYKYTRSVFEARQATTIISNLTISFLPIFLHRQYHSVVLPFSRFVHFLLNYVLKRNLNTETMTFSLKKFIDETHQKYPQYFFKILIFCLWTLDVAFKKQKFSIFLFCCFFVFFILFSTQKINDYTVLRRIGMYLKCFFFCFSIFIWFFFFLVRMNPEWWLWIDKRKRKKEILQETKNKLINSWIMISFVTISTSA